ncbi:hypothetical protein Dsin_018492 [Dipteronia sinensis]|uniref:Reverse transcriptase n=1 Tax=Dipteronia sinensis TaxID=43782 RepID=A0AAE0E242_9ROSI|nr:hypothetical protein Dsin_018492 [Dipteronia sinensis]
METKSDNVRMEILCVKLGFVGKLVVNCSGRSGGLCMLWSAKVLITLLSFSVDHIDVQVDSFCNKWCRLTVFYGNPASNQRFHSWNLLKRLAGMSSLPWVCLGYFNEVLDKSEKMGGIPKNWNLLTAFREALDDCGLEGLGFVGPLFTWCNKREGETMIQERLDRCTGSIKWKLLFPHFTVFHLDYWRSDHRPILLEFSNHSVVLGNVRKKRRFHFEECWMDNQDCRDLISRVCVDRGGFNAVDVVIGNIKACGLSLDSWNGQCKRRLKEVIINKKMELKDAYNNTSSFSWESIHQIEAQLDSALEIEERYWRQRSRIEWLKCGDRNTRFFHMKASVRQARNKIKGLFGNGGQWYSSKRGAMKAPGRDGLPALFYQRLWGKVGLGKLGFSERWINLIMRCISSVSYSFVLNGDIYGDIKLTHGLRQGDPLSPYLFIICAEGFSTLVQQAVNMGNLQGFEVQP